MRRQALLSLISLLSAASAVAVPPGPAPSPRSGPPDVWVQAGSQHVWMARGSGCWAAPSSNGIPTVVQCGDLPLPLRGRLPSVHVRAGAVLRVHVEGDSTPTALTVRVAQRLDSCDRGEETSTPVDGHRRDLTPGAIADLAIGARDGGLATLLARFAEGDASYYVQIDVAPGPGGDPPRRCRADRTAPRLLGLIPTGRDDAFLRLSEAAGVVGRLERGNGAGGWVAIRPIRVGLDASEQPRIRLGSIDPRRRYRLDVTITDRAGNTVRERRRLVIGRPGGGGRRLVTLAPS